MSEPLAGSTSATSDASVGALRELPRRFGRYTLFDFVGKGGMAELYLSRADFTLGGAKLAVVKQILPQFAADPVFAEMLVYEAKLAARLSHANIVQVFDLGRAEGQLFIGMEYVEGLDLNALLRRCSQDQVPFTHDFAIGIVCDLLRGLDYAHRRTDDDGTPLGIVHRDVSPSNVLVSFEGEVKLCDFGIARAHDRVQGASPELSDDTIKGKAGYMSPEQAKGEPLDGRSDVFAAGIVLWELCAGRRMYRAEASRSLLDLAREARVPPFPEERELPEKKALLAVIEKALAPRRDDRFASAASFLRALEDYAARAKLVHNSLRLGEWLRAHFADEITKKRGYREETLSLESLPPTPAAPQVAPASAEEPASPGATPHPARASDGAIGPAKAGAIEGPVVVAEGAIPEVPPESRYGPSSLTAATVDVSSATEAPPADPMVAPSRRPVGAMIWVLGILALLVLASYLLARS